MYKIKSVNSVVLGLCVVVWIGIIGIGVALGQSPKVIDFNMGWSFRLDSVSDYRDQGVDYQDWRQLNLPHDWSIELPFDSLSAGSSGTGYLSGGVGWYKKMFTLSETERSKRVYIEFGGIYENSEVWINNTYLGHRPNGYVPIVYDLTAYVNKNGEPNVITVKVDNSKQPNSRFYTGSGIYRNVKLFFTSDVTIAYNSTFITTPVINEQQAKIKIQLEIVNHLARRQNDITVETQVYDPQGDLVSQEQTKELRIHGGVNQFVEQNLTVAQPLLWSPDTPHLYRAVTIIRQGKRELDRYTSVFGIRSFHFDAAQGFFLNGQSLKIRGVCLHSDLGALGMAFNRSAAKRQLQIMKDMGVNGIRTSHNPTATEFLDLCDEFGFIVMSETFDVWKHPKNPYDYHLYWDEWYERDLVDHIKRDRNHPSLFIWCLGNEAQEQWHDPELGSAIPVRLAAIVDSLDGTRPTTIANNEMSKDNPVLMTTAIDIVGYNYNHQKWLSFPQEHPGRKLIVTESTSALESRGQYDLVPMDSIRKWPVRWDIPFDGGNEDKSISAYDHVHTPWGSTHEESLRVFETYSHVSGMYVWTGFDYLGEPTPYTWPARSSYFGIVDLAGFPKDVYYLYQSVWTETPVLHILPHWNWQHGDTIDVVTYYNQADEVELFVNDVSKGRKAKEKNNLHVSWAVPYEAGSLTAIAYQDGVEVRRTTRHTTGEAVSLVIKSKQDTFDTAHEELAFLEVLAIDVGGNEVSHFNEWVNVDIQGGGRVVATDNGCPTDLMSFQSWTRKAYNGKLLVVVKGDTANEIIVSVHADGLKSGIRKLVMK
ncbi:glycoside hydrolase family 2 protein [Sphingobacterium sp. DN00404]|uniref:Glycoside hydrolase family 2 protein n=1 Tax=Sphingobacterium micropteri TaxID=2763501 RepID=A0ABR7YL23_9SPHI|nr:glycoside hydrolase family 2 TIM barrel-domain containing protein [Sphingobacterium micropteri]MBD1432014.1 glycoside hydrolase family 2 protein [Sphingobacterium micropteri]